MTPAEDSPMARSWEAEFMELWRAGVETAEIARQMGIPQGTVSSRAHVLQLPMRRPGAAGWRVPTVHGPPSTL
jgi:hypothetical protein